MTADFDWDNDPDIVQRTVMATAVYPNNSGRIVIRQQADWNDSDDVVILVAPENALAVARAIVTAAGLTDESLGVATAPKDRTAAARQRRYRQRHNEQTLFVTDDRYGPLRNGQTPATIEGTSELAS